jgi:hypothetical protein
MERYKLKEKEAYIGSTPSKNYKYINFPIKLWKGIS